MDANKNPDIFQKLLSLDPASVIAKVLRRVAISFSSPSKQQLPVLPVLKAWSAASSQQEV